MEAWIAGALSLVGAALGVWLSDRFSWRRERQRDRQEAFREALGRVERARVLQRFPLSAGGQGAPRTITDEDVEEFARKRYLESVERYFVALSEAREAVAGLAQYGVDVDLWVEDENFMEGNLAEIAAAIRSMIARR